MATIARRARPTCPDCGFAVFNRRHPKCERCGAALPETIAYTAAEIDALRTQERADEDARALRKLAADARKARRDHMTAQGGMARDLADGLEPLVDWIDPSGSD